MYIKHTLKPNYNTLKQFATHYCPEDWFYEETLTVFLDTQFEYHIVNSVTIIAIENFTNTSVFIKLFNNIKYQII